MDELKDRVREECSRKQFVMDRSFLYTWLYKLEFNHPSVDRRIRDLLSQNP